MLHSVVAKPAKVNFFNEFLSNTSLLCYLGGINSHLKFYLVPMTSRSLLGNNNNGYIIIAIKVTAAGNQCWFPTQKSRPASGV